VNRAENCAEELCYEDTPRSRKSEDTPRIGSLQLPQSICEKEKILRPFAARHGAAARLAQIKRATALAETIWANA
jgi:hypothetical protein